MKAEALQALQNIRTTLAYQLTPEAIEGLVGPIQRFLDESEDIEELDGYGNPVSGDEIRNCCFPDCGCDGSRLCMAKNGPSFSACAINIERGQGGRLR